MYENPGRKSKENKRGMKTLVEKVRKIKEV